MPSPRKDNLIAISPEGQHEPIDGPLTDWCKEKGFSYNSVVKAVREGRAFKKWQFVTGETHGPPRFEPDASPREVREQLRRYIGWIATQDAYYAQPCNHDEKPDTWNAVNLMRAAEQVAKANNIKWDDVGDNRDPEDKALDAAMRFVNAPDDIFATTDEVLEVIETQMKRIIKETPQVWDKLDRQALREKTEPPPPPKVLAQRAERWLDLLRRLKAVRRLAREPRIPELDKLLTPEQQESCHVARFMVYTGRSNITGRKPADEVYKVGTPQVRMSVEPWLAEHGYDLYPGIGLRGPGDINPHTDEPFKFVRWVGIITMAPPRHSKTDMTILRRVLRINQNPRRQAAYIHDNDEFASSRLVAVRRFFDPNTLQGRRNLSLFPDHRLSDKGNNANNLTIWSDSPTTNPSLVAYGIGTSRTGINLDDLDGDDLVPSSDIFQPTERARRIEIWDRTWMTRLQGTTGFLHLTGYPQHQDDLLCYYESQAELCKDSNGTKGIKMWMLKMPVGGPDDDEPFAPIMPELYDADYLQTKWASLADKTAWASNYMLKPLDERDRIVKVLRIYDQQSPEHKQFMQSAEIYIGLDPALKGDETGDKAGLVIVAVGDCVETSEQSGIGMMMRHETQIRVIEEREFHATQSEINVHLLSIAQMVNITKVYIEQKGGGSSIMDALANYHGVSAVEGYDPGHANKEMRLRSVSAMLENSNAAFPAKVLFPGDTVPGPDGMMSKLVMDDRMNRLANYIINFRSAGGYHSLDGLTMCLIKLRHRVETGLLGEFSQQAQRIEEYTDEGRVKRLLQKQAQERKAQRRAGTIRRVINSYGA